MYHVVALHFQNRPADETEILSLLGHQIELKHINCHEDVGAVAAHIQNLDGEVDAIGLVGVAQHLRLGNAQFTHEEAGHLFTIAQKTPVVDGLGILPSLERWAVRKAHEMEPGIWAQKNILMVPGLNHTGLAEAMRKYTSHIRYADPFIYFNLPNMIGVGSKESMPVASKRTLEQLKGFGFQRLFPKPGAPYKNRSDEPFEWGQVLAGDIGAIRRYAPQDLPQKTVVVPNATAEDHEDLKRRGVSILMTTLPNLSHDQRWLAKHSATELEACLAAILQRDEQPLNENTYLNLMADLHWKPAIRYLQPDEAHVNRFAYVTQPLTLDEIRSTYTWTKFVPGALVKRTAAHIPPLFLGRAKNITSPATNREAEGVLFMLGGTPEEFARRETNFVYRRLLQAAHMAEKLDARLLGVSTFTDKLGEASELVSHKTDIAITSGRSLAAASAMEAATSALMHMGHVRHLKDAHVVVIKATRPSVAACTRYLAAQCPQLTLVASSPEKLISLKREIESEYPEATVRISTTANEEVPNADLILAVTPISAEPHDRPFDITRCKPGAVICDLSRPYAISREEADLRPDILVVHAGKFRPHGRPKFEFNFGLPDDLIHPSLAESAILALEGRFEDFSLGRHLAVDDLREIFSLAHKHGFTIGAIRSYNEIISEDAIKAKRQAADELRRRPEKMADLRASAEKELAEITKKPAVPERLKGQSSVILTGLGIFAMIAGVVGWLWSRRDGEQ